MSTLHGFLLKVCGRSVCVCVSNKESESATLLAAAALACRLSCDLLLVKEDLQLRSRCL